jgi:type IV pilus assembly protein PilO
MAMTLTFDFKKLPWYSQLGVFATLGVLSVAAFWHFYASSAQVHIDEQRAELLLVQAEVDRGLAIAKQLPEFRKQISQLEAQFEQLRAVLPEEQDVADLLRRVQGMATESNLTIKGFSPQAVAKRDLHAEWPIGLRLEGTYHDLGSFLERVSRFGRIINVGSIKITAKDGSTGTISAQCTATTFVLIEQKAPDVKPGTQAAVTPTIAAEAL